MKCPECNNDSDNIYQYCKPCNSGHFRDNFKNWSSGDIDIDKLIQDSQLNARNPSELLEWVEYSNIEKIEHIADGGFGNVYKAIWKDGPIGKWDNIKGQTCYWNGEKSDWYRSGETR